MWIFTIDFFLFIHLSSRWTRQCWWESADKLWWFWRSWWRKKNGWWFCHPAMWSISVWSTFGNVLKLCAWSWNLKIFFMDFPTSTRSVLHLTNFVCFTFLCAFKFCSDKLFKRSSFDELNLQWIVKQIIKTWRLIKNQYSSIILPCSRPWDRFITISIAKKSQGFARASLVLIWRHVFHACRFSWECWFSIDCWSYRRFLQKEKKTVTKITEKCFIISLLLSSSTAVPVKQTN